MGRDVKQLMVEVPTELADQLHRESDFTGMTKGSIVQRALRLYLGQLSTDMATERLAIFREVSDYPDRRQLTESALRHYVDARLNDSRDLSNLFDEVKRERAKTRVVPLKEARKD